jgi:hypothetical protein
MHDFNERTRRDCDARRSEAWFHFDSDFLPRRARRERRGMFGSDGWGEGMERGAKCAWEVKGEGRRPHCIIAQNDNQS